MSTRILLISNSYAIVLKGGKEMDTGIAYIIVDVMILVGAIIAGVPIVESRISIFSKWNTKITTNNISLYF